MNPIERIQVFVRVAELASFTQAAEALGWPKATVSTAVRQLEEEVGARLLHRTTRRVTTTQDGQAFYERCKDVLADLDELQSMFQQPGAQPLKGRVRLDMSTGLARHAVIPQLPSLLMEHPQLDIELSSTERRVDLVREGFDCVLRAGNVTDTGLVARPLGTMRMVNCASPAYRQAHGTPRVLADLTKHQLVHFVNTLGARSGGFEYEGEGQAISLPMAGAVTVNNAGAFEAACLAGLGIIQVPRVAVKTHLQSGHLVEVLPDWLAPPMPLTLLYANRRNLSKRVRIVMDWLSGVVIDYLKE